MMEINQLLLNSLPKNYKEVKAAIKYVRDSLSLDTVLDVLRSKDFEIKSEKKGGKSFSHKGKN